MTHRFMAFSLGAVMLFSSCTRDGALQDLTKSSPSPSPTSADGKDQVESEEERLEADRLRLSYSPDNPPPVGFVPAGGQTELGDLTMAVKFDPTCVEQGNKTRLTARTNRPNTRVSFITTLEDQNGHAVENDGRTDAKGMWTWEFEVNPSNPPHTYEMLGAAIDEEKSGEGNSVLGNWFLVVAERGRCS